MQPLSTVAVAPLATTTTTSLNIMGAGIMSSLGSLTTLSPAVFITLGAGVAAVTGIAGVATAFITYKVVNHIKATYNIAETTNPPTNGLGLYKRVNQEVDKFDMLHEETIDALFDKAEKITVHEKKSKKDYLRKVENQKFLDESTDMPPTLKKLLSGHPRFDALHVSAKNSLVDNMKKLSAECEESKTKTVLVEEINIIDEEKPFSDTHQIQFYDKKYNDAMIELRKRKNISGKLTPAEYLFLFAPQFYDGKLFSDTYIRNKIYLEEIFETIVKAADESEVFSTKFTKHFYDSLETDGVNHLNTYFTTNLVKNMTLAKGMQHTQKLQEHHWSDRLRAIFYKGYDYLWNEATKDENIFNVGGFFCAEIKYDETDSYINQSEGFVSKKGIVPSGGTIAESDSTAKLVSTDANYSYNPRSGGTMPGGSTSGDGGGIEVSLDTSSKVEKVIAWRLFYTILSIHARAGFASHSDYYYFNSRCCTLCSEYNLDAQESYYTVLATMYALSRPRLARRVLGQAIDVVLTTYSSTKGFFSRLMDV